MATVQTCIGLLQGIEPSPLPYKTSTNAPKNTGIGKILRKCISEWAKFHGISRKTADFTEPSISRSASRPWNREIGWALRIVDAEWWAIRPGTWRLNVGMLWIWHIVAERHKYMTHYALCMFDIKASVNLKCYSNSQAKVWEKQIPFVFQS